MPDLLRTSLSGLLASQRAISTTGNNIANANTDGYSRQSVQLSARLPTAFGNGFVGNGVDVITVTRNYDQFVLDQLRGNQVELGRLDAFAGLAGQVDNILSDPNTGIATSLGTFFSAWQDVANVPASIPSRQLLVAQAGTLADRFRQTSQRLDALEGTANDQVTATVAQVNSLAQSIARLNRDIGIAQASVRQPPNDLLDTRDKLITQLSELVGVSTVAQDDGAVNVFIGSGQPLVIGGETQTLGVQRSEFDLSRVDVVLQTSAGPQAITSAINGGQLGGVLQFRSQVLDQARDVIGQIASGVAYMVNQQNAAGLDLNGLLGGDIFGISPPSAQASTGNASTATLSVQVTDIGALQPEEYILRYDGTAWSAVTPAGRSVALTGTGTALDPLVAEGLSLAVGGTPAAGDRFLVRSTRNAAGSMRAALTDPRGIAAAGPIRTSATATNIGNGVISAGTVVDATNPALLGTVNIAFTSPTTYTVNGSGSFTYTPGNPITINGWEVSLSGTPVTGDSFRVERNAGGTGDNRNALLAAGIQSRGVLNGGTASVNDAFGGLVGQIGTITRQANITREAQSAMTSDSRETLLAKTGVNLDEEAADLLRWQQAYQASARVVSVVNDLFNSLLNATGR